MPDRRSALFRGLVGASLVLPLVAAAVTGVRHHTRREAELNAAPHAAVRPARLQLTSGAAGRERLIVVIASSSCAAARAPGFADTVRAVIHAATNAARDSGFAIATLGVATDPTPRVGLRFLESLGPFDEIALGRSWLNSSAIRLMWRDHGGPPTVPQIVLLDRVVDVDSSTIRIGTDSVVGRLIDMDAMRRYLTGAHASSHLRSAAPLGVP